jgi:pyruvate formate lyase activating enzyme
MSAGAPIGRFWRSGASPEDSLRCELCPHRCALALGQHGLCRVRLNEGGRLVLPYYGALSAAAIDPIEKKPLYHFLPGSSVYSAGYLGCNLRCPFCQNYHISQTTSVPYERVSPKELIAAALASGCPSLAHTYSEPLVHAEYLLEAMTEARKAGLYNVLVTNGCVLEAPAREILALCDAANVDLKAWDPLWYRGELGGELDAVKDFITLSHSLGVALEITTLVIPGKNDADQDIQDMTAFLADLSADIPYHLSAYHPDYRYAIKATPAATIRRLASIARQKLRYVYPGNLAGESSDTRCPSCGQVLVSRVGYRVSAAGLSGSRCARCGSQSPIRV